MVVPGSGYHMAIGPKARLASLYDEGLYEEIATPETPSDPLKFRDIKRYADRLKENRLKTGAADAIMLAFGRLEGQSVTAAVQDFAFQGGTLGMAAGEAIIAGMDLAVERRTPFIMFTASGGARMQEGMFALMQMPRTTVAVQRLRARETALYRRPDQPHDGRRHRVLRDARRRACGRAWGGDRLRRRPGDRADDSRAAAGRISARRISASARHDRHGGAAAAIARRARPALPAPHPDAGPCNSRIARATNPRSCVASALPVRPPVISLIGAIYLPVIRLLFCSRCA